MLAVSDGGVLQEEQEKSRADQSVRLVQPSLATHAIWIELKAGETADLLHIIGGKSLLKDTSRHYTGRARHYVYRVRKTLVDTP